MVVTQTRQVLHHQAAPQLCLSDGQIVKSSSWPWEGVTSSVTVPAVFYALTLCGNTLHVLRSQDQRCPGDLVA